MITAGDFRNGVTFEMDGQVMQVVEFQHVKPGKGAAFVRTKMKNVITGAVTETSFNPTAKFENAYVEKKDMEYSYNDGDLYYFMDQETYDMIPIAAEILGEINSFYTIIPGWDTMLHTINGFLVAAVGFCLVDLFNRSERFTFKLSPLFLAIVAFCFSMTVGVLWEFFEFTADQVMHTDMQKDYVVHEVNSVSLNPDGLNVPVHVQIESVIVNGEDWTEQLGGYLDIGLIDTMKDLQVNCIGAIAFSIIGFFYVKHRGKGKLAAALIPVVLDPEKEKSKKDEQNREPNDE